MNATEALAELLLDLYRADELRILLTTLPDGQELSHYLPDEGVAPVRLAYDAVALLQRCGRVDGDLFFRIIQDRPARIVEIMQVGVWCLKGPAAAPAWALTLADLQSRPIEAEPSPSAAAPVVPPPGEPPVPEVGVHEPRPHEPVPKLWSEPPFLAKLAERTPIVSRGDFVLRAALACSDFGLLQVILRQQGCSYAEVPSTKLERLQELHRRLPAERDFLREAISKGGLVTLSDDLGLGRGPHLDKDELVDQVLAALDTWWPA